MYFHYTTTRRESPRRALNHCDTLLPSELRRPSDPQNAWHPVQICLACRARRERAQRGHVFSALAIHLTQVASDRAVDTNKDR